MTEKGKGITIDVSDTKTQEAVKDQAKPAPSIEVSESTLPAVVEVKSLSTMKKIVDTIDIQLQHEEQAKAVAAGHSFLDTNAGLTFGAASQRKYLDNLKTLLGDARIGDLQGAGSIILEFEKGIDIAGIEKMRKQILSGGGGFFAKLFGGILGSIKAFAAKRQEIVDLVNNIEARIEKQMHNIMMDNARLDEMLAEVKSNFYELGVWIYAGELALERGGAEYDGLRQKAVSSGDPIKISETSLFKEQVIALDTRLLRMKSAYVKAPITLQKVLTTQQAGRIEVQTLMDSMMFDLPAFIETINTLLALYNIKGAQEDRERRERLRDRLAELEGNILDEVATRAKEGQIRGAKEVKMVEAAANKIISTCKKLKELDDKNAEIRRESETLLVNVMDDFRESMEEISEPTPLR